MEKNNYVFKMVEKYSKGKILDLGCGKGVFSDYLQRKGFEVTGIDINSENLEIARQKNKKVKFVLDDVTSLRLREKYDTILLFGVLEYLVNVDIVKYLSDLRKILNKEGSILIEVPNSNSLRRRIKILLNFQPVNLGPHYDFNDKRIKDIIKEADYKIIKFTSTKIIDFRKRRVYMPFDGLATEFFIVIKPKGQKQRK